MSGLTFEQLRIPLALILLIVVAFVFLPRGDDSAPVSTDATPSPTVVVGQPGGEVLSSTTPAASASAAASATAEPTAVPTEEATPEPTERPVARDGFSAEILACRSISGSSCNGELGSLPANAGSFTALVRFSDANAGDVLNAILSGPSGTIPGGAYTLQGGGDGYYYSTFGIGGLPSGEYTLTATRNGTEVATTRFRRGG